jgi:hypothetical protein
MSVVFVWWFCCLVSLMPEIYCILCLMFSVWCLSSDVWNVDDSCVSCLPCLACDVWCIWFLVYIMLVCMMPGMFDVQCVWCLVLFPVCVCVWYDFWSLMCLVYDLFTVVSGVLYILSGVPDILYAWWLVCPVRLDNRRPAHESYVHVLVASCLACHVSPQNSSPLK